MENETLDSEQNALNESPVVGSTDEFSSIRAHYEEGLQLTDNELNKIADVAVSYLRELLSFFGENNCSIDEYDGEEGELILDITGGDLAILIGRHGNTLEALQMILSSLMSAKLRFHFPISVDVESYKSRRRKKLQEMALSAAIRAKKTGKVSLAPMSGYERRLIHITLRNDLEVTTHSEGEDPYRRVVITAINN